MVTRGRLRDLFLVPAPEDDRPEKLSPAELRALSRQERRQIKIRQSVEGGRFRTWVYLVTLLALVGGFAAVIGLVH